MQVQQAMDTLSANELEEGERVLWTGQPHPRSRSNTSPAFTFIILTAIFGFIGILGLLIVYSYGKNEIGITSCSNRSFSTKTICCCMMLFILNMEHLETFSLISAYYIRIP